MMRVAAAAVLAVLAGCKGSDALPPGPAPVASVSVTLGASSLTTGQTTAATAVLYDATGAILSGRPVTWSSTAEAIAGVDGSGTVTAVAAGTAMIAATSEGRRGEAAITIVTQLPAGYRVLPLEIPAGMEATAADINADAGVVGFIREGPDGRRSGAHWDLDGRLLRRWDLDEWHVDPRALNATGQVVATVSLVEIPRCRYGAFLDSAGIHSFPSPALEPASCVTASRVSPYEMNVTDIDDHGRVVGTWTSGLVDRKGFVYEAGEMRIFNDPQFFLAYPIAISALGYIVGSTGQHLYPSSFWWRIDGQPLGKIGPGWGRSSTAIAVNNDGVTLIRYGFYDENSGIWDLKRQVAGFRSADLAENGKFLDINSSGTILGWHQESGPYVISHPMFPDSKLYPVADFDNNWTLEKVLRIDDAGRILAHGHLATGGNSVPIILVP